MPVWMYTLQSAQHPQRYETIFKHDVHRWAMWLRLAAQAIQAKLGTNLNSIAVSMAKKELLWKAS
jgi:hypothetical protein